MQIYLKQSAIFVCLFFNTFGQSSGGSIKGRTRRAPPPPLLKIKFASATPPPRTEKISNSAPPLMVFPGSATGQSVQKHMSKIDAGNYGEGGSQGVHFRLSVKKFMLFQPSIAFFPVFQLSSTFHCLLGV